ncbi:MAG: outer membrane beta-barrel protein [Rikenellaceae bacterium]|jgi:hypothetical protein|nr:outer membrane beta-barrel protein [Rikenellaceae bacterium]
MKKLIFLIIFALCAAGAWGAGNTCTVTGSVTDECGEPVPFATVVLMRADSTQVAGTVSADDGAGTFSLAAPAGSYILLVQYVGYQKYTAPVKLAAHEKLAPVVLKAEAVGIEDVVVTTQFISRQADRFVVNVAGSTQAIGRTASEMLALAPGVWITDEKLSVNGKAGARVMINDRLLQMETADLLQYLKTINAEDIQRIEVIPSSGADYDADSSGGIIKITLKKRRNDGMDGSLSLSGATSDIAGNNNYNSSVSVNYRRNQLSLYTTLSYDDFRDTQEISEKTVYTAPVMGSIVSGTGLTSINRSYSGRLGTVWDFKENRSVGAEVNYSRKWNDDSTLGQADFTTPAQTLLSRTRYGDNSSGHYLSATANYIWRTDTVGSVFKVIGDVQQRKSDDRGDFLNESAPAGAYVPDSIYNNVVSNDYRVWSLTASWEHIFSPKLTLKAGGKFTYNDMWDRTDYNAQQISTGTWEPVEEYSGTNEYSEKISALYAITDMKLFKKVSVSAGLRAEHTYATPRSAMGMNSGNAGDLNATRQDYLSLFPNLNVSVPLNEKQSTQLIFQYARKIQRPGFWALNPYRMPTSRYSYILGNPHLQPTFNNDISITAVLGYKYTLTVGANLMQGEITQVGYLNPEDPEIFYYKHVNVPRSDNYYANLNLPITFAKWWEMNVNVTAINIYNDYNGVTRRSNGGFASLNNTFNLPAAFSIEFGGWGRFGKLYSGNMQIGLQYSMEASLKKRFFKNKLTASFKIDNLFNSGAMDIVMRGEGFEKTTTLSNRWNTWQCYNLSLRYNFNAGKAVKVKNVESNAAEEGARMSK